MKDVKKIELNNIQKDESLENYITGDGWCYTLVAESFDGDDDKEFPLTKTQFDVVAQLLGIRHVEIYNESEKTNDGYWILRKDEDCKTILNIGLKAFKKES